MKKEERGKKGKGKENIAIKMTIFSGSD